MDLREASAVCEGLAYRHPWEMSRAISVLTFVKGKSSENCYADIGAGDRYFARALCRYTNLPVYAVDIGYTGIESSEEKICLSSLDLVPEGKIDCMILLDVLEHLTDDRAFLESILTKLKPSGHLIITVPAYQFLFSSHDRFFEHKRRYNRKQLIAVLNEVGIVVDQSFYFYLSLFFVRLVQVLFEKAGVNILTNKGAGAWHYSEKHPLTVWLTSMLNADFAINCFMSGVSIFLPGLSLCCLGRKKSA